MDGNNLNILVEAKKEYTSQLCSLIIPLMVETFSELYTESIKISKNKKVLMQYQILLKEVPNWNNHMVKQHTVKLCTACSWFGDLLAAVFVSNVKILSSVRLNSENKKISLKLPSNEVFIHGCYVACAKDVYKNPFIYHENNSENDIENNLFPRFRICIEETIKNMIPVQQILHTYISQGEKMEEKNIDFESEHAITEADDPDLSSESDEEVPEPAPASETVPEPAPEPSEAVKDIRVSNPPVRKEDPEIAADDDDVLFPGAPDKGAKKD
jgi:hypothetical protein